jgi:hypothetical protein
MRERWSWSGACALVLAITVGGGWFMGVYLAGTPPTTRSVGTSGGLDVLSTVGGVLAGALASYVGSQIGGKRPPPPPEPPPEETHD